jgi:NitT/TauT family transport system substrate-binding protein
MRRGRTWTTRLALLLLSAMAVGACGTSGSTETTTPAVETTVSTAPDTSGDTTMGTDSPSTTAGGSGAACATDGELRQTTLLLPFPFAVPFFSIYVADARGYFEDEGLEVSIETADGSASVVQQVVSDRVEFGISDPGPIVNAVGLGEELEVVYVYQTGLIYGLVTEEGAPYESIQDLAGSTIGVSSATAGEVPFLEGLLASNGIDPETDVSIIESGDGGPTAVAFGNDSIDAYFSDYFNLIELGFEVPLNEFDLGEFGLLHAASVVVTDELVESDPQLIECVTRAMARATEFSHASPEAALIAIAEAYPEQVTDPEGFDLLAIEETIKRTEQYEGSDGRWGYNRPESWVGYVDLLASRGELTEDVDPESLYTNDFIDAANDFDAEAEVQAAEELAESN